MKYIVNSIKLIKKYLRYGQVLFPLESTTYPGTSEEVILPYLKRFNLGKNFFLFTLLKEKILEIKNFLMTGFQKW